MIVFFSNQINAGTGELSSEDSKHCYKVLRKKIGDEITVLDGVGGIHLCKIETIEKNKVYFNITETTKTKRETYLPSIAVSLLKNTSRLEWFLEKATEIGVGQIQPINCKRTLKGKFRIDRAESIVMSAAKQSMRAHLPELKDVESIEEIIKNVDTEQKFICHYNPENTHLYDALFKNSHSYLLIGPEGDFTPEEIQLSKDNGWKVVNISSNRLRTETAAITACQIVALKNRNAE